MIALPVIEKSAEAKRDDSELNSARRPEAQNRTSQSRDWFVRFEYPSLESSGRRTSVCARREESGIIEVPIPGKACVHALEDLELRVAEGGR
jgi:hypothetical protein